MRAAWADESRHRCPGDVFLLYYYRRCALQFTFLLSQSIVAQAATDRYFSLRRQRKVTKRKATGGRRGKYPPAGAPRTPSHPPLVSVVNE